MLRSGQLVTTIQIVKALILSISANQARSAAAALSTRAVVKRLDHDALLADIIDRCYKELT
jgi:hypothetical protein